VYTGFSLLCSSDVSNALMRFQLSSTFCSSVAKSILSLTDQEEERARGGQSTHADNISAPRAQRHRRAHLLSAHCPGDRIDRACFVPGWRRGAVAAAVDAAGALMLRRWYRIVGARAMYVTV
jgi:hypothetical protein